jgi:hypothetical protein
MFEARRRPSFGQLGQSRWSLRGNREAADAPTWASDLGHVISWKKPQKGNKLENLLVCTPLASTGGLVSHPMEAVGIGLLPVMELPAGNKW